MTKFIPTIPDYPEDASIRYGTPTRDHVGKSWSRNLYTFKTEEEARNVAAGWSGNGSGIVIKKITYRAYYDDGKIQGSGEFEFYEELKPVTKFDKEGQKRRERYLEIINCKHTDTYTRNLGAGCQTWSEEICSNCGKHV